MLIEPITDTHQGAALFTDLYELSMLQAYEAEDMKAPAVFELYFRELPTDRNYIMAAGDASGPTSGRWPCVADRDARMLGRNCNTITDNGLRRGPAPTRVGIWPWGWVSPICRQPVWSHARPCGCWALWITLCRGRTYGTIATQVVTHRIAMRQCLLNAVSKWLINVSGSKGRRL